jgi:hypothetical protein
VRPRRRYLYRAATTAPAPPPAPASILLAGIASAQALGQPTVGAAPSGFVINDVGDAGWVVPTLNLVPHDYPTHAFMAAAQPGSRIQYIDTSQPVVSTALAIDQAADTYFVDSSQRIVDSSGSLTGAGGVAYGSDWRNPTGPIKPFKSYSYSAVKSSTLERNGDVSTNRIGYVGIDTTTFRANKPDVWLGKRGTSLDMYSDVRQFLDDTGRAATAAWLSTTVTTAGGVSKTQRAWIGSYGPVSDGLFRIINPLYRMIGTNGGSTSPVRNQGVFDVLLDGSVRDRAIRPIDWPSFADCDTTMDSLTHLSTCAQVYDLYHEGVVINQSVESPRWSATATHTTPIGTRGVDFDVAFHRCVFGDSWNEKSFIQTTATKAAGDAAQTFAPNTTAAISFPTMAPSLADWNGTTHTIPAGWAGTTVATSWYGRYWYLMDVSADIAAGGTIRVGLFVNGVEVASKTVTSVAAGSTVYKLHGTLYIPETGALGLGLASGSTVEIRVTTTSASGTISVAGTGQARLVIGRLSYNSKLDNAGLFAQLSLGSRYSLTECISVRNGYDASPIGRSTFLPDGKGRWDFNIRNHNFYTVGDCDLLGCRQTGNMSFVGAAGDVPRNPLIYDGNFNINGYYSFTPEHLARAYVSSCGSMQDNVFQIFKATTARTANAHPGIGVLIAAGSFGMPVKRNIISDPDGVALYGLKIGGSNTPYENPSQLFWRNNTSNHDIADNHIQAMSTAGNRFVIEEANGENYSGCQWNAPITYSTPFPYQAGVTIATCTPTGYPSQMAGATFQWNRYADTHTAPTKVAIAGATGQSRLMTSDDIGTAVTTLWPAGWSRLECVASGDQQPAPLGTENNLLTNNVLIRPSGNSNRCYYTQNAFSNIPSATAGQGAVDTTVPNDNLVGASSLSFSGFIETGTRAYESTASAMANEPGGNWDATLKTGLEALGATVAAAAAGQVAGLPEYWAITIGATPATTAFRHGRWDPRLLVGLVNHVKTGHGMATI